MRFVLFAACLSASFAAIASNTVYWQTFHTPPNSIKTGNYKNQGFVDQMLALIINELPEYRHFHPLTTHVRAMENMRSGKQVCHPALFVTEERKQFVHFSTTSIVSPAIHVVMRKADAKRLQITQPVDLNELIGLEEMVIGLIKSRSYGQNIDSLIGQHPTERYVNVAIEDSNKMLALVANGRLSLVFAYPFELAYYNKSQGAHSPLVALSIRGEPQFTTGAIACSKTPWGQNMITELNRVLLKLHSNDEYIKAMTTWLEEDGDVTRYGQSLKRAYQSPDD